MNKRLFLIIFMAMSIAQNSIAQNFYDMQTVQDIYLTFAQSNWDYILDTMRQNYSDNKLLAQININGTVFDSVGVNYKGNSSYNANNLKNAFHIELDYMVDGQDYQGYQHVKLSNVSHDPSFLRETLSYEALRNYMPASGANYARVYVNGNYHGLYVNQEAVNKQFVEPRFYSSNNPLFLCDKPDGITGTVPAPNLAFLGADSSAYYNSYDLKSDYGYGNLATLTNILNNNTAQIEDYLEVDRALWMLAFNNLFVNLDSYTGSIGHNYYVYEDNHHRFNPIVWDLNESFGSFTNSGVGQLTFTQMKQMDPLLHATSSTKPLIQKLFANQTYKKMYLAHLRTMLNEMIVSGWYQTRGQELQNLIAPDVQADNNKFFSYTNFIANLTNDVTGAGGPGGGNKIGLVSLMEARKNYLQTNTEILKTPPSLANIQSSPSNPTIGTALNITATVTNPTTVTLAYRYQQSERFVKIQMYDDGLHNDQAAADGIYGAQIPANPATALAQYYIYAENNNAGIFSPARAEYEFYNIVFTSPIQTGQVVINEFLAANVANITDPANEHDDWIELYNTTNNTLSLVGLYLSDDPNLPRKWALPNINMSANSYLIVWADENNSQGNLHANFKLSKTGEAIYLSKADDTLLDSVVFGAQNNDISTGRYPNGTGNFTIMPPTFSAQNQLNLCSIQPLITGNTTACFNGSTTYSVPVVASAVYVWTISNGAILTGQGTNTIQVQWNNNAIGTVNVVQINP
jgi:spore coat protein CotH